MIEDAEFKALVERLRLELVRLNNIRRGHVVTELTTLSLLIDQGIASPEEIAQRMSQVQKALHAEFRNETVDRHIMLLTDILRVVYGPKKPRWTPEVIQGSLGPRRDYDPEEPSG